MLLYHKSGKSNLGISFVKFRTFIAEYHRMGLFDFLKKKVANNNTVNELEILLKKATSDPSKREEFYRRLLSDQLFILSDGIGLAVGEKVLEKDTSVKIVSFEDGKIPVFTSTERIFDKGVIKEQVNYVAVKGEDLFNFTMGATFLLNPYSDYSKELLSEEIKILLSGTIFHSLTRNITIQKETNVLVGQPAIYPTDIIHALIRLLEGEAAVRAAYLGWIKDPNTDEPPHYVFCIDADGDTRLLNDKAGKLVQQFLKSGEFVDFVSKGSLGGYFDTIAPFYKK